MLVDYTKMNGLKNDFILFLGPVEVSDDTVIQVCDREAGLGADGVLVVTKREANQVQMDYWNSDGSKAEMCGNGLRCVARFAVDNSLAAAGPFIVHTASGPLEVVCSNDPEADIEIQVGKVEYLPSPVSLYGLPFYEANVGNPHAITFVDDIETATVTSLGPKVEHDKHFPNRTNVEFVQVLDAGHIKLRIWERGVGETLACGTGMVASAIVSRAFKKTELPVTVEVKGGTAKVWEDEKGFARLLGPVETMHTGQVEIRTELG